MNSELSSAQSNTIIAALAGFDCAVIYLFGSYSKKTAHPGSDIDIAFLTSQTVAPMDCFYLASTLSEKLGKPVDLVDLSHASTVFAKEVIANGIPLFVGNTLSYHNFEMYTLSDYARLNEERKEILAG